MTIEIVDFPINSMVIFHSFLYVYQRVSYRSLVREIALNWLSAKMLSENSAQKWPSTPDNAHVTRRKVSGKWSNFLSQEIP